eukprot:3728994-Pyramimonas_sp.AAC.1
MGEQGSHTSLAQNGTQSGIMGAYLVQRGPLKRKIPTLDFLGNHQVGAQKSPGGRLSRDGVCVLVVTSQERILNIRTTHAQP